MKSPKFPFSHHEISTSVNPATIKAVWKSKVLSQLRKHLIRDLIEYRDYNERLDALAAGICLDIERGDYTPRTPRHYLIEKSRGLCRQMTMALPRDLAVLQCLTNRLQKDIVANQPTKKAYFEPGQAKFNKDKIHISTSDYGSIASWKRFQTAIFEFSKNREYVVVTDIANFYDFINLTYLRNIVSSICLVKEPVLDFLIYILEGLSWRPDFMPRSNIGLPQMEAEAPRVLANAMLFELDRVAVNHSYDDYVRFMDDIDVGVDTIPQAKIVVRDIDLTLQSRQLRLNSSKTKILSFSRGEIDDHFCIRENRFLDYCTRSIENKAISHDPVKRAILRAYKMWKNGPRFRNSRFTRGNGEKIFKRVVSLMHHLGFTLTQNDAIWFIQNVPSLRQVCFDDLARQNPSNVAFHKVADLFYRGFFVDDASYAFLADYVVHGNFRRTPKFKAEIFKLVDFCTSHGGYLQCYASLLIGSKYLDSLTLLDLVRRTRDVWGQDYWLGRLVGGLAPLMERDLVASREFGELCRSSINHELQRVVDFHWKLRTDLASAKALVAYATAPNPSYPGEIIYPKMLIVLSLYQNTAFGPHFSKIKRSHGKALRRDIQFREWIS